MVTAAEINDDIILDCYRLAAHYHVSPDVFLNMEADEVDVHIRRTIELQRLRLQQQQDES